MSESGVPLVAVVAVADNGVIGAGNAMPWRLPTDLKRFKALTMGRPMIMGRRTFASIGRPLPGRATIVLTRDAAFAAEGVQRAASVAEAVALAQRAAGEMQADEIAVVGGAEIYRAMLPLLDRMEITRVHARPEGDTHFSLPAEGWRRVAVSFQPAGDRDSADMSFETWVREAARPAT